MDNQNNLTFQTPVYKSECAYICYFYVICYLLPLDFCCPWLSILLFPPFYVHSNLRVLQQFQAIFCVLSCLSYSLMHLSQLHQYSFKHIRSKIKSTLIHITAGQISLQTVRLRAMPCGYHAPVSKLWPLTRGHPATWGGGGY